MVFFFCLKTGYCETTSGQRISFPSFSLANDVPLWYAYSGFFSFELVLGFFWEVLGWFFWGEVGFLNTFDA